MFEFDTNIVAIIVFAVAFVYVMWRLTFARLKSFSGNLGSVETMSDETFKRTEFINLPDGRLYEVGDGKASLMSVSK